jgi:hypothetical protein
MGLQNRLGCIDAKHKAVCNPRRDGGKFDKLQIPDNVLRIPSPAHTKYAYGDIS